MSQYPAQQPTRPHRRWWPFGRSRPTPRFVARPCGTPFQRSGLQLYGVWDTERDRWSEAEPYVNIKRAIRAKARKLNRDAR